MIFVLFTSPCPVLDHGPGPSPSPAPGPNMVPVHGPSPVIFLFPAIVDKFNKGKVEKLSS